MKYYSTNKQAPDATLEEAVVKGLAADKGLFMPFAIKPLPQDFYDSIDTLGFQEIAYRVADAFFGEDVPADTLKQIVYDTLSFDVPLVKVTENIYSLELFHGPTLAFKDVGGRFYGASAGLFHQERGQEAGERTGCHFGGYGQRRSQRFPRCGRNPCLCTLSERQGERNSGEAVHYAGTEHHSP